MVVLYGMMPRPSGSTMTRAFPEPIPATNPSIHASYAAVSVAPPAEYCAQSRKGMLYATSTGTRCSRAACAMVAATASSTSSGEPPTNHAARGTPSIAASPIACRKSFALANAAICATAPGLGDGTKKRVFASSTRLRSPQLRVPVAEATVSSELPDETCPAQPTTPNAIVRHTKSLQTAVVFIVVFTLSIRRAHTSTQHAPTLRGGAHPSRQTHRRAFAAPDLRDRLRVR